MRLFNRWAGICVVIAISVAVYLVHAAPASHKPARPSSAPGENAAINPFRQDLTGLSNREAANYWSAWGDYYSNAGPVDMAITCFLKATQLDPSEAVHHVNLANTVSVFRRVSCNYFGMNEQAVLQLALQHYRVAAHLEPKNHEFARLLALTYYSVSPVPTDDAIVAWKKVLSVSGDDCERQDACLNMARLCIQSDQLISAQDWLNRASDDSLSLIKNTLARRLQEKLRAGRQTSS